MTNALPRYEPTARKPKPRRADRRVSRCLRAVSSEIHFQGTPAHSDTRLSSGIAEFHGVAVEGHVGARLRISRSRYPLTPALGSCSGKSGRGVDVDRLGVAFEVV